MRLTNFLKPAFSPSGEPHARLPHTWRQSKPPILKIHPNLTRTPCPFVNWALPPFILSCQPASRSSGDPVASQILHQQGGISGACVFLQLQPALCDVTRGGLSAELVGTWLSFHLLMLSTWKGTVRFGPLISSCSTGVCQNPGPAGCKYQVPGTDWGLSCKCPDIVSRCAETKVAFGARFRNTSVHPSGLWTPAHPTLRLESWMTASKSVAAPRVTGALPCLLPEPLQSWSRPRPIQKHRRRENVSNEEALRLAMASGSELRLYRELEAFLTDDSSRWGPRRNNRAAVKELSLSYHIMDIQYIVNDMVLESW